MKNFFAIVAVVFTSYASATQKVVISNLTTGWSNALNFLPAGIPQNGDVVTIPMGLTISVKGTVYSTLPNIKINVLGTIDFDPSGKLDLGVNSIIQLYTGGKISSNGTSSELIVMGGVVKYNGQNDGTLIGPKYASVGTATTSVSGAGGGFSTGVLPIKIHSFTAKKVQRGIELHWNVSRDSGGDKYILQRARARSWDDLRTFVPVTTTSANEDFSFIDSFPEPGTNLYRLKLVEINGETRFSSIIKAEWSKEQQELIAQYDVRSGRIRISWKKAEAAELNIYNVAGQQLKQILVNANTSSLFLDWIQYKGIHFIELRTKTTSHHLRF